MPKSFDVQGALKAGYSRDEVNAFLKQNQGLQTSGYSAPAKPMSGLLGSILNPVARYGKMAGGAAFELGRAGVSALGNKNAYVNQQTGETVQNPFMSEQDLSSFDSKKGGGLTNFLAQLQTQNSGARQGLKDTANVASNFIPVGKGASLATKYIAPGAVSGGLTALSNEDVSAQSVLGGAIGGGATSGALAGLGKIFSKSGRLAQGAGGKLADKAEKKATQEFLKTSPSVYQKAIEDHGFDVGSKAQKYGFTKMGLDDILGDVSTRGKGGALQANLSEAEKVIQQTADIAGKNIKISGDDIVKELTKRATEEGKKLGGGARASAIKEITEQAKKNYKNGVTVKQALKILRDANSSFGKSVVEDTSGAVATSAQKLEANTMRTALKKMFPEIKDALDTQSELLTLRPILNQARAKASTTGVAKSAVGLNELMGVLSGAGTGFATGGPLGAIGGAGVGLLGKKAIDSPLVNKIAGMGLEKAGSFAANAGMNPMLQQILMTGAAKTGGNATSSLLNEPGVVPVDEAQGQHNSQESQIAPPNDMNVQENPQGFQGAGASIPQDQTGGFPTITPDLLAEGILSLPPEAAAKLKQIYDIQQKNGAAPKTAKIFDNALNSIDQMEDLYGSGTKGSLSLGKNSTGIGGLLAKGGQKVKENTNQEYVDKLNTYKQFSVQAVGILNQLRGAGTLNEGEFQNLIANIPNENTSEKVAQNWFKNMRQFVDGQKKNGYVPQQQQQFDPSALSAMGIGL